MIHEIGRELDAYLIARKCPVRVYDGPAVGETSLGSEYITIERAGGDSFATVRSQRPNPTHVCTRSIGVLITIRCQSTAPGALSFEHYRRCEHVIDFVLAGLREVITARKNGFAFQSGEFVDVEDLAKSENVYGAKYELRLTIDRGVHVWKSWTQALKTTGSIADLGNVTRVGMRGDDDDGDPATPNTDAATACGG